MNRLAVDSRRQMADLAAFAVVAEERSFTRAAARLGVSQSALSHALKALEERLGLRLLSRSTRSVSTTEAGERLLAQLRPALQSIDEAVASALQQRESPVGKIRLTTFKLAAMTVLWPMLPRFLEQHPGIELELHVSDALVDIVAEGFDAGIRLADTVEKDMIAVPVGPAFRIITVAAPAYLQKHGSPREPEDLLSQRCLRYRLSSSGRLSGWKLSRGRRSAQLGVEGPLTSNDNDTLVQAALAGLGVVRVLDGLVAEHLQSGRLVQVLPQWVSPLPRLTLYHPSRRQIPPALQALITALKAEAAVEAAHKPLS